MNTMAKKKAAVNKDAKLHAESYKLVILRSDTFLEVGSVELSIRNIYIIISSIVLIISACIILLISFTPLKKLIPGYGDIEANEKVLKLIEGVDILNDNIEANDVYIGAINNILTASSKIGEEQRNGSETKGSHMINSSESSSNSSVSLSFSPHVIRGFDLGLFQSVQNKRIVKPISGVVSSEFKPSVKHYGIDILAPANTVIVACMDGYVFSSSWDIETGNTISIQHEGNILSFYKHNSLLLKEKGTFVRAGEAIAVIGNTGTLSNGPHLHFELWHSGKAINPKELINFN